MQETLNRKSAGGIVHCNDRFLVLRVLSQNEIVFPKGTMEKGETPEQTAIREIFEETGYKTKIKAPLGEVTYEFDGDDGKHYQKTVYHFLLELEDKSSAPTPHREKHEVFENAWLTAQEAREQLTHDGSKDVLEEALEVLKK